MKPQVKIAWVIINNIAAVPWLILAGILAAIVAVQVIAIKGVIECQ